VENTESLPHSIQENWARSGHFNQPDLWPLPAEESALIDLRPFLLEAELDSLLPRLSGANL